MRLLRRFFRKADEPAADRQDEPVWVATAQTDFEAQLWRDLLAEGGIRCMVRNVDPLAGRGLPMPSAYSQQLWVLQSDVERAREILGLKAS